MASPSDGGAPGHPEGRFGDPPWPPDTTVGGTELTVRHLASANDRRHRAFHDIFRAGANDWVVAVGDVHGPEEGLEDTLDSVISTIRTAATGSALPSDVLGAVDCLLVARGGRGQSRYRFALVVARIELDARGALVTLACTGLPRTVVLRHAGWLEIRRANSGPADRPDTVPFDDRIGLGPGDALVVCSEALAGAGSADGGRFGEKVLPDVLVDAVHDSVDGVADCISLAAKEFGGSPSQHDAVVLVLRVPEAVRHEGLAWVVSSTGTSPDHLQLPASPRHAGDSGGAQAVLPPQEALIRLAPEPPSVPALRRLLRRLLENWRMDSVPEGDIELLATEVATNAFARTASPVTVIVRYTGAAVRVEVGDGEREQRPKRRLEFEDLRGHRLVLVESLASDWGVSTTPTGSRMWFEVAISSRR